MFPCPHCGKPIESDAQPAKPQKESPSPQEQSWGHSGDTQVTLGCSTLILIAIIVSMFSRSGDDSRAIRDLQRQIQKLEKKIDDISKK